MKIKFIKEYRAFYDFEGSFEVSDTYKVGEIKNATSKSARWLINNGFAEEVKESGRWKPKKGEAYYYLDDSGIVTHRIWMDDGSDENRFRIGNCFKTREAIKKWRGYLKAIVTVRQDEGVIDLQGAVKRRETTSSYDDFCIYTIAYNLYPSELVVTGTVDCMSANAIWFDTIDHADASLDKHPDEWKIISNYDWSRE